MTERDEDPRAERALKRLDVAIEARNFEIGLFWKRSFFFWAFIAAAFIGYGVLNQATAPELRLVVACFGLVASAAWTLTNRGSKYWQESWEQKLLREEQEALGGPFFSVTEPVRLGSGAWLGGRRYSVSRLAIALSDFTTFVWCVVTAHSLATDHGPLRLLTALLTLAFILLMFLMGRSSERTPPAQG